VRPARLPRPWCEPGVSGGNVWCRLSADDVHTSSWSGENHLPLSLTATLRLWCSDMIVSHMSIKLPVLHGHVRDYEKSPCVQTFYVMCIIGVELF